MAREKLILFTHADQFQQKQLGLSDIDLERSLKNTILLFGKVTLPGSSVLKSNSTFKLIANAKDLLQEGLIIPDLRDEYKTFGNYVEKNKKQFQDNKLTKERASFLDNNTKNIISFPATDTSDYLENNLLSSLFYLKLNNQLKVSWSDLSDFATFIKKPGISDRSIFLAKLDKVASPGKTILSTTQALYHTLGALVTESNPIWPQVYTETFENIRSAQHHSETRIKQSREAQSFIARHSFITAIQELNSSTNKKIKNESLNELYDLSFISSETLDALNWSDVIELSKSRTAIHARKVLFKKNVLSDHIDLKSIVKTEKRIKGRISKIGGGITLASLITGGAGCVNDPIISTAGLGLSVAGLLLTLGDILIKSQIEKRLNSYSILGEQITKRAFENKADDRLVRF